MLPWSWHSYGSYGIWHYDITVNMCTYSQEMTKFCEWANWWFTGRFGDATSFSQPDLRGLAASRSYDICVKSSNPMPSRSCISHPLYQQRKTPWCFFGPGIFRHISWGRSSHLVVFQSFTDGMGFFPKDQHIPKFQGSSWLSWRHHATMRQPSTKTPWLRWFSQFQSSMFFIRKSKVALFGKSKGCFFYG